MEGEARRFDHLREHSIGLPQVLFQSITHMAPAAAVAYSIYISVPDAKQALPLSVLLALVACLCAATAIGQLAKHYPSAGGLYTYAGKSLGPWAGFLVAFLFIGFQPLVAPFLYLEFGWAMHDVFNTSVGWHWSGQWVVWVLLMAAVVFLLTYRDVRISTTAGVILGAFEIAIFGALAIWMLISNAVTSTCSRSTRTMRTAAGAASSAGWSSRSSRSSASRPPRRSARKRRIRAARCRSRSSARRSRSDCSTCCARSRGCSARASTTSSTRRPAPTRGATSARSSGAPAGSSSSWRSATRSPPTPTRRSTPPRASSTRSRATGSRRVRSGTRIPSTRRRTS